MTTHEPTIYVHQDNPGEPARYTVKWPNGVPAPEDTVLMSVEMFERSIEILNGQP